MVDNVKLQTALATEIIDGVICYGIGLVYGGGVGGLETKNERPLVARFDLLVFWGCWGGGIGGYGLLWVIVVCCAFLHFSILRYGG